MESRKDVLKYEHKFKFIAPLFYLTPENIRIISSEEKLNLKGQRMNLIYPIPEHQKFE